jgi:predicted ribosomally synthesized peptide with SipW-like signal peptide
MKLSLGKKVLLSLGVVAAIGALAGAGTFATFTAQTTNPSNKFASGTLVLSNQVNGGSVCLSTGGGNTDTNANGSCSTAFNLAVKKPGDSGTTDITLQNVGSLAASALKVFSGSCSDADAAGETYHGTGSPCGTVQIYIQQYSDAFTTKSACLYGGATGAVCDFSDTNATLSAFVAAHTNLAAGLGAGPLAASGGADTTWIRIGVMLPSTADNTLQGRSATMALNWHIIQV